VSNYKSKCVQRLHWVRVREYKIKCQKKKKNTIVHFILVRRFSLSITILFSMSINESLRKQY